MIADALRTLFSPGGQLVKNSGAEPEISTVESFIAPRRLQVDDGELTAFPGPVVGDRYRPPDRA